MKLERLVKVSVTDRLRWAAVSAEADDGSSSQPEQSAQRGSAGASRSQPGIVLAVTCLVSVRHAGSGHAAV